MSDAAVPLLHVLSADISSVGLGVLAALSLVIGVLSGMVGMSLCVMRLPLMLAFGIDPLITAGTNLAVGVVSGATATWPHYRAGRVVLGMVVFMGLPSIAGAYIGGHFAHQVPTWVLLGLVSLFLVVSGVSIVMAALKPYKLSEQPGNPVPREADLIGRARLYAGAAIGLVIGLVGGAGGAILGTVRVPALVTVVKMEPALAVGTATVLGIIAGLSGFVGHVVHGDIDWALLGIMGGTAMVGSFAGARLVDRLNPGHLRLLLGIIVFGMAPVILYQAIGEFPA